MPRPNIDLPHIGLDYQDRKKSDITIQGTDLGTDATITVQYPKLPAAPTITWKGRARPFRKGGAYYLKVRLTASNPGDVVPTMRKKKEIVDLTDVSITATNHDTTQVSPHLNIQVLLTDH